MGVSAAENRPENGPSVESRAKAAREATEAAVTGPRGRTNWTRGVRRALIIVSVFFVFQQITGINVPFYYGPTLLGPIFGGTGSLLNQTVAGLEVTAMLAAVNVVRAAGASTGPGDTPTAAVRSDAH
jgi:hypothetical protein